MADKVAGFSIDPSEQAIKELSLPTYSQLHARVGQLEAALSRALAIANGSGADFTWQAEDDLRDLEKILRGTNK